MRCDLVQQSFRVWWNTSFTHLWWSNRRRPKTGSCTHRASPQNFKWGSSPASCSSFENQMLSGNYDNCVKRTHGNEEIDQFTLCVGGLLWGSAAKGSHLAPIPVWCHFGSEKDCMRTLWEGSSKKWRMRTLKKQQKYEASLKHAKEYGCSVAQPLAKQRGLCERKQCLLVSYSTSFGTALIFGTISFSFAQQCLSFCYSLPV